MKTRISRKDLDILLQWQAEVLHYLDVEICQRDLYRGIETKEVRGRPVPLTRQAKQFILECAHEALLGYLSAQLVEKREWQTLALASIINAMVLSGFEEHCARSLHEANVFAHLVSLCDGGCGAKRVKFYQMDLILKGFDCPKTLYPTLTPRKSAKQTDKGLQRPQRRGLSAFLEQKLIIR
jgi:hypothetical protein